MKKKVSKSEKEIYTEKFSPVVSSEPTLEEIEVVAPEPRTVGAGTLPVEGGEAVVIWHGPGGISSEDIFSDRQASSNKGRRYGPFEDQGDGSLKLLIPQEDRPRRMKWEMYI